ncbi:MAG TPA: phosphopantetheine-binding protein, partial [Longimicrobiales bacterium]|nr:phosphopantetheine-binding protein [Longimicrobiales bacterium]
TEAVLAQIWAEVLKRERIGRRESFLELGGHSLLAIRVLGRISKQLGVRLPLRSLFDAPTIAELAGMVDKAREAAASGALTGV